MPSPFRSLRVRLTFLFLIAFGVLQVVLWLGLVLLREHSSRQAFDTQLTAQAETAVESLAKLLKGNPDADEKAIASSFQLQQPQRYFYECRRTDNDSLLAGNLQNASFGPFLESNKTSLSKTGPSLLLVPLEISREFGADDAPLRLVSINYASDGSTPFQLNLAASTGPLSRVDEQVQRLLVVFLFTSLVIAGIITWLIVRRSLSSLGIIAGQARELFTGRSDNRIPDPGSGDELADTVRVINEMLDRRDSDLKIEERFLTDISHELRTPLTVILGHAQAIGRDSGNAIDCKDFAGTVETEVRQLLRTIEGFFVFMDLRQGRPGQFTEVVSMEDVLLKAIRSNRNEARDRNIRVTPHFDDSDDTSPPVVRGDFDLLVAMTDHIIRNSIRHAPESSNVDATVTVKDQTVSLVIRDQGPGVEDDVLERFHAKAGGAHRDARLAGKVQLGIAIIRGVARLHHADASLRNCDDVGCEATIHLPLAQTTQF